jgi:flagellum-specific ATP synthase
MLTLGKGQRAGIMAGSGVGKSVLLGMLARNARADVSVIALIGERGREVREFIENNLGPEGLKRSVVICATSDQAPLVRMRGAWLATTIAEYFRDRGKNVLLMMDSVTRFAMAQREIGLAVGEPPATRGYTPSVFATLPRLLERAGNDDGAGSLTALYTVLIEGDDLQDPIGDAVRSILDGHIVLSRSLAERGHYPAVDVLASVSRVMPAIADREHQDMALKVRSLLADYREAEDLIHIGAYKQGVDARIDEAIARRPALLAALQQSMHCDVSMDDALDNLRRAAMGPIVEQGANH